MIEIKERATLETKPFTLNFGNNPDAEKSMKQKGEVMHTKTDTDIERNTDDLSKYPVIYIDGVLIENRAINSLKLFNDGFVPSLILDFTDPSGKLLDENLPLDNSIVSLFKESTNKDLMALKMDFKITDFTIIKGTSKESITFQIDACIDVNDFYLNNFESYKGTSYSVLQTLCKKIGLGFGSNIENTKDDMVWINPSNYKIQFFKEIVERSYIDDDTFLYGYVDFYYNFIYVDIEKQMNEDISEQMNMMDNEKTVKNGVNTAVPLILTNVPDQENSNLYISRYTLVNSSTNVNLQYGYNHMIFFYDKTEDDFKKYTLDNITTEDGNNIILKGNPSDKNGLYENMCSNTYMGKLDLDNVHEKYLDTILHNRNNLRYVQKLKMVIRLKNVNYSLYRFQKVLVELYNMAKVVSQEESRVTPEDTEKGVCQNDHKIIHKLSGEWLITAINFTYSLKEGNIQELTLVKRELTDKYTFPRRKKSK